MVIRELIQQTIVTLRNNGSDNPIFEAHSIIRFVLKLSAMDLVLQHNRTVSAIEISAVDALLNRRISGEPLQYILGVQEFMSLDFAVTPDVLIPRSDTETLVEYVLSKMKNKGFMLLDIGTGTGCIPLSIAHFNPRAFVRGIDVSEKALAVAEKNRKHLGLEDRSAFEKIDILAEIPHGKYDIITSNPPYIESDVITGLQKEVKDFEPHIALDGGRDGLMFFRRICKIAPKILVKGGMLVLEIGYNQGSAVSELMKKSFSDVRIIKDLCNNDRVATGILN
ncbi:MAG: peptide chain release factor N(5)-glutamine methyltransferase [Firmicutes bacterium]|nr:peptide chain release factor N(5)-glutamine methyltransferase [Bacillota bacterium]